MVVHRFDQRVGVEQGIEGGLQPLALHFRLLAGAHQFIHIPQARHIARDLAAWPPHRRRLHHHPAVAAEGGLHAQEAVVGPLAAGQQGGGQLRHPGEVVGMDPLIEGHALLGLCRPAQAVAALAVGTDPHRLEVGVEHHHQVAAELGEQAEAFALVGELLPAVHHGGDVHHLEQGRPDRAPRLAHGGHGEVAPDHTAIDVEIALGEAVVVALALQQPLVGGQGCGEIVGMGEALPTGDQQLLAIAPQQVHQRIVHHQVAALRVGEPHGDGGVLGRQVEECVLVGMGSLHRPLRVAQPVVS